MDGFDIAASSRKDGSRAPQDSSGAQIGPHFGTFLADISRLGAPLLRLRFVRKTETWKQEPAIPWRLLGARRPRLPETLVI